MSLPPDDLPRSPTGRVPQWVVDDASGLAAPSAPVGQAHARRRRRARRAGPFRTILTLLVVLALAGAVWAKESGWAAGHPDVPGARWLAGLRVDALGDALPDPAALRASAAARAADVAQARAAAAVQARAAADAAARKALGFPSPGVEEAAAPLGQPPVVAHPDASYKFLATQSDGITPVAWDPCRPIHYVTSTVGAPAGGQALVTQAVAAVAAATGLRFVDDGATTEVHTSTPRPLSQPDRYGDRWSPVLITWDTPTTNPGLEGDVAGMAGPQAVTADGTLKVDVTGTVSLDSAQVMAAQKHDRMGLAIVTHELGHLVGLDHVEDPTQLMNPVATPGVRTFGAGDLTGLALLGSGKCDARL